MTSICSIIIVTHNRADDLAKALASLGKCAQIEACELIVVENSEETEKSRTVVEAFTGAQSVRYFTTDDRSLAKSRNLGARAAQGQLLCFFDDDMRFGAQTLAAYIAGAEKYGEGHFFGGPLVANAEVSPAFWLRSHLPPSALGFGLGEAEKAVTEASFLGGNCCFFREMLLAIGGFPEYLGTTENYPALAEETVLQSRLIAKGHSGIYLPEATVMHGVPADNCSRSFALHRSYRLGLSQTLIRHVEENLPAPKRAPMWMLRNWAELKLLIGLKKLLSRPQEQIFPDEIAREHQRGVFDGLKYLRKLNLVARYGPTNGLDSQANG